MPWSGNGTDAHAAPPASSPTTMSTTSSSSSLPVASLMRTDGPNSSASTPGAEPCSPCCREQGPRLAAAGEVTLGSAFPGRAAALAPPPTRPVPEWGQELDDVGSLAALMCAPRTWSGGIGVEGRPKAFNYSLGGVGVGNVEA